MNLKKIQDKLFRKLKNSLIWKIKQQKIGLNIQNLIDIIYFKKID